MGKEKIKTVASKEPVRWAEDGEAPIARGPTEYGNDFDIRMSQEPDGVKAAKKVVGVLKERGVCLCEANAPAELLSAACDEAEQLWEDGHFSPPLRVSDDRSMLEARLWSQALVDEEKVVWLRNQDNKATQMMNALKILAKNIADFGGGLASELKKEAGVEFNRYGHAMLSCYTGDRQYTLHLDNAHGDDDDDQQGVPDNGMRLTCTYFINVHWDPAEGSQAGGLDVHLTDPKVRPESMAAARRAPKLRVAPHADTLVLLLSEHMAHQVIRTTGNTKWFAITVWSLNADAMQQVTRKMLARQMSQRRGEDSEED